MQNRTLTLSLLMSAAFAIPSLAIAAPANTTDITAADMRTATADSNEAETIAEAEMDNEEVAIAEADVEAPTDNTAEVDTVQAAQTTPQPETTNPPLNKQPLNIQHSDANYQPLIANEASTDEQGADAPITLQEKKKDSRGELLATQPADIELQENRRVVIR